MIIIDDVEQNTKEWLELKAGIPGASSFAKIVTTTGDPSTQRSAYLHQLAGEKLLGTKEPEPYVSWSMQRGMELEQEAREAYEFIVGEPVRQVGFVFKDEARRVGCSPDGLAGLENPITKKPAGLEIKCPNLANHIWHMVNREIPYDKFCQIHGSMWVCGFHQWTFISYYPGLEPVIIEVQRDYKFTIALESEMMMFLDELDEINSKLKDRR